MNIKTFYAAVYCISTNNSMDSSEIFINTMSFAGIEISIFNVTRAQILLLYSCHSHT